MKLIWRERLKRTIAGMLAVFLLFSSCIGVAVAEEDITGQTEAGESEDVECDHPQARLVGVKEATCEKQGYTGDLACPECSKTIEYGNDIPMLEHSWDEGQVIENATCETTGLIRYTCTVCSDTKEEMLEKTEHNIVDYTCTNCGQKLGSLKLEAQSQQVAGEEFKVNVVLDKDPGISSLKIEYEFNTDRLELISVEDKGILKGYDKSETGYLLWKDEEGTVNNIETETIATLTFKAKAGCYGTAGIYIKNVEASNVNDEVLEFTTTEEIQIGITCQHQSSIAMITKLPTCEEKGEITYTCRYDSSHTWTEEIQKSGHMWDDGKITKEATCREDGEVTYICLRDSNHTWVDTIGKTGHSWDEGETTQEVTCEDDGIKIYTCLNNSSHTKKEIIQKLGHDYTISDYKMATQEEDGYEKYRCTRCEDEYEEILPMLGTDEGGEFEYDDASGATSNSLTFYVGYFGMNFVKKTTLSLSEIQSGCPMITQTFSYINKRPRVVYDVATGPRVTDVLRLAGVDMASAQSYLLATEDSAGNYYNPNEITNSTLYSTRFFYPNLSKYFLEDGTFSNRIMASSGAQVVEPMLAIWDSWITYGIGQEFTKSEHTSNMKSGNCFRLLYGQSSVDEQSAITSAKWINAIYVRYTGTPNLDAGDDLNLSISSDYTLSANVSTIDEALTEVFQNSVRWSSSDESVVKVDAVTGKITVVGEGTVQITASANVDGVTTSDTLTISVSADEEENLQGGGDGNGIGTGTGNGTGDGNGTGTGTGDGNGIGNGVNTGNGDGSDGEGTGVNKESGNATDIADTAGTEDTGSGKLDLEELEDTVEELVESEEAAQTEEIQVTEEESTIESISKSLTAFRLNFNAENNSASGGSAGGQSGGGTSGEIVLNLETQTMWRWTALFACTMLLLGGASMYRKFRREL